MRRISFMTSYSCLFLFIVLVQSAYLSSNDIVNVTDFGSSSAFMEVKKPTTLSALKNIILAAKNDNKKIAVAGAQYSQGGQTLSSKPGQILIDTKHLPKHMFLDAEKKQITVSAGSTWHEIQQYIDPYGLALTASQSYNDFTVGGSLSVNAHGRDITYGQIVNSVIRLKIMLADGSTVEASPESNSELFNGVIGGYGWLGIIVEATLQLTDNVKLERIVHFLPASEYGTFYTNIIKNNPKVVLHNANIYPPRLNTVCSIAWQKTDKKTTINDPMQNNNEWFLKEYLTEIILRRIPFFRKARVPHESLALLATPMVVWRNYEMSYTVKSLAASVQFYSSTFLQEYFIPKQHFNQFIQSMSEIIKKHNINVLNVSIRDVPADNNTALSYAPQDSFALVMYVNILQGEASTSEAIVWTRKLINAALDLGGTYYLPYHLWATQDQFNAAYPGIAQMKKLKNIYDPHHLLTNKLFEQYADNKQLCSL